MRGKADRPISPACARHLVSLAGGVSAHTACTMSRFLSCPSACLLGARRRSGQRRDVQRIHRALRRSRSRRCGDSAWHRCARRGRARSARSAAAPGRLQTRSNRSYRQATRLWGRAHIGLRCADSGAERCPLAGLPAGERSACLVRRWSRTRPIAAGQTIGADDLATAEVEWTREAQGVLTDVAQFDGRVASRPIAIGQPIPLAALRAPQAVAAGDQVRIVGRGTGFSVDRTGRRA